MAAKQRGLYEVRTRVTAHLPVNNRQEEKAFFEIANYIRGLKDEGIGISGYTHSSIRPAAFHGWWSVDAEEWLPDEIVLVVLDYNLSFNDARLSAKVEELKQTIRRWYRHYGSPQEEVWVVAQEVIRQD